MNFYDMIAVKVFFIRYQIANKGIKMSEIYKLDINGKIYETSQDKPILRFLRDDLKIKSVKDGCSEGTCGTCTIIVNEKAMRSCILTTKKAVGKKIVTIEGMSENEKEAFVFAFGASGAVQCGFCIPGMVLSGKALIDKNPNPTEDEIKSAIKGNVCRCTGYVKIIEAISLAAKILRGEEKIDESFERGDEYNIGSTKAFKLDSREKTLGTGIYPDDVEMPNMAHASAIRSKYPRAKVLSIDTSKALELEGVIDILTAKDVPNNKVGHIQQDWDVMIAIGDITRNVGDAICVVIAENEDILKKAKELVIIDYEELQPVRNIFEAQAADAPKIHPNGNLCQKRHVTRGNAKEALKNSKYTVTQTYETPFTEHAFLEPECAIAFAYKDGVKILTTDQSVYDTRHETAMMFGWEPDRIVVENLLVGGGFGGKEDVSCQHIAALCAMKINRPVKIKFSREESLAFHPKRHAMVGTFTLGCDENGIFTALDCDIYFDTGAYASLAGPVLERACTHSVGPYCYQNTDIRGYSYYTNNQPAGAFRGFGVCQSEFALEQNIDLLAQKVGISPWEIRYINAIEPGKVLPNGQIADCSTALKETLEALKDVYEANRQRAGISCAMKNSGVGVGLPDKGRAKIIINNGIVEIYCAASDIGQGCFTLFVQMCCETTKLPMDKIKNKGCNSELAPDSGTTSGSRQTLVSGEAIRMVSLQLKEELDKVGGDLSKLEGREFYAEYFEPTDKLGSDVPNPKSHIAYGYATHVVILDDDGRVSDVYAAHDSGKVINPLAIEGQVEGGVMTALGYTFTEDWVLDNCVPTQNFGKLGLFRAPDIPKIHSIFIQKDELLEVGYGSKGIGEISTIPTAPAAALAYYARDGIFRNKLPIQDSYYAKKYKLKKKKSYCDIDK